MSVVCYGQICQYAYDKKAMHTFWHGFGYKVGEQPSHNDKLKGIAGRGGRRQNLRKIT